jgi:ADP-heptose:LPS heptosyltransferase
MKPPKKSSGHITDYYVQQFVAEGGFAPEPWQALPNEVLIKAAQADINRGKELLKEIGIDSSEKLVVIQPGSGSLQKCWHLDNFLAIAKELGSRSRRVVFLLGPTEMDRFSKAAIKKISGVAMCLTDLSLTQVLGILSCADAFVGNDSGITHLAAGLGIKTVAVFGPTNPDVYKPIGPAVTVLTNRTKAFAGKPLPRLQKKILRVLMA